MPNTVQGANRADVLKVPILNGGSLSAAIDVGQLRAARVQIPALWTTANLTFQTSIDGVTYADLYDGSLEYTITAAASREILLPIADFLGIRYLKIRSGTSGTPVNQVADRTLLLGLAA